MKNSKKKAPLRVIPLGGLGEVGLNLMVIECGDDILVVDCGVLFPDLYWLGLDLVLPDFSYLVDNQKKIKALIVTHGHEDHIGAIPFLLKQVKIPIIYASRFANRLIEDKCEEHGVLEKLLPYDVQAGEVYQAGCFEVEFIHVTHSTLETFALAVRTPHGVIVHSGDFKFDETPYDGPPSNKARFSEIGMEKPLLLLSDSTNSERAGHSLSERAITTELEKLVREASGAIVVALFASNIHRVHQLMDIAEKFGRKVFLSGRSMERYVQIAIEQHFLPVKLSLLQPIEEIEKFRRKEILVLSTGSQGESRSSLFRLARNENRWLKIEKDDVVILSSRNIPGNEKAISYVINELYRLGAIVHYEDMKSVHVSGHAYQSEQLELISLVRPRYFIPVHGEYRHLLLHSKTAALSEKVEGGAFVLENGHIWEFDGERAGIKGDETARSGRQWVFGPNMGQFDDVSIKERRIAARSGIIIVTCLVGTRGTALVKGPEVNLHGFLSSEKEQAQLKISIAQRCEVEFQNWFSENPDGLTREQAVGAGARRVVKRALGTKPLVIVHFINNH